MHVNGVYRIADLLPVSNVEIGIITKRPNLMRHHGSRLGFSEMYHLINGSGVLGII